MPVVPSGNVTSTVLPGSPVPETLIVPSGFGVIACVEAIGAVLSTTVSVVGMDVLPASSVCVVETLPVVCGVAESIGPKLPSASTVAVPVAPSGNVTSTVLPGSPVPETLKVPSEFGVTACVEAIGAVVSVTVSPIGVDVLPAASV